MHRVIERFAVLPNHPLLSVFSVAQAVGEAIVMGSEFQQNRLSGTVGKGILEAHSGYGLGRTLMGEVDPYAKAHGLHPLELTVMATKARARSLYDSTGYVVEGTKRDSLYVNDRFVDEIMLAKLLTE
jgi:RimJ/RimL family protein N-acetyltransferase